MLHLNPFTGLVQIYELDPTFTYKFHKNIQIQANSNKFP